MSTYSSSSEGLRAGLGDNDDPTIQSFLDAGFTPGQAAVAAGNTDKRNPYPTLTDLEKKEAAYLDSLREDLDLNKKPIDNDSVYPCHIGDSPEFRGSNLNNSLIPTKPPLVGRVVLHKGVGIASTPQETPAGDGEFDIPDWVNRKPSH